MEDLKRCPFCGHRAELITDTFENEYEVVLTYALVKCMTCGTKTKKYKALEVDTEEAADLAIDAWNTRWTERE